MSSEEGQKHIYTQEHKLYYYYINFKGNYCVKNTKSKLIMQWGKRQRSQQLKYILARQFYHFSPQNTPQCLLKLIKKSPAGRKFLVSWLKWCDDRKEFIFNAFTLAGPKMNQAEVIHAS